MANEPKTMQEEMNEEFVELAMENINTLIPEAWNQHLNEVLLPKILGIMKLALKKGIKDSGKMLGENKMMIVTNMPVILNDGSTVLIPHAFTIDKRKLENEVVLKEGETPDASFSYLALYEKINGYKNVKDIMLDVKSGNIFNNVSVAAPENKIEGTEQKQIDQPK